MIWITCSNKYSIVVVSFLDTLVKISVTEVKLFFVIKYRPTQTQRATQTYSHICCSQSSRFPTPTQASSLFHNYISSLITLISHHSCCPPSLLNMSFSPLPPSNATQVYISWSEEKVKKERERVNQ